MLTDTEAFSGFAVDDVERAREFYEDTLGRGPASRARGRATWSWVTAAA